MSDDDLCQNCGHSEDRHDGGASCIECRCKEFAYPADSYDDSADDNWVSETHEPSI